MQTKNALICSALAAIVALAAADQTLAGEKKADGEKCYGVAKSGKNDCKTLTNACAGHSTADAQKDAFIVVPKGTCERIVGGTLTAPEGAN